MNISEPGEYVTRDGSRVTIRDIYGPSTFPAKGAVWRMYRGEHRPRGFTTWALDGRYRAVGEHPLDIVGKPRSRPPATLS